MTQSGVSLRSLLHTVRLAHHQGTVRWQAFTVTAGEPRLQPNVAGRGKVLGLLAAVWLILVSGVFRGLHSLWRAFLSLSRLPRDFDFFGFFSRSSSSPPGDG